MNVFEAIKESRRNGGYTVSLEGHRGGIEQLLDYGILEYGPSTANGAETWSVSGPGWGVNLKVLRDDEDTAKILAAYPEARFRPKYRLYPFRRGTCDCGGLHPDPECPLCNGTGVKL